MFKNINPNLFLDDNLTDFIVNVSQDELNKSRASMKQYREKYKMISRKIMQLKSFTRKNYQGGHRFIYDQFARSYLQTALAKEKINARNCMAMIEMQKYHLSRMNSIEIGAEDFKNCQNLS